MMYAPVVLFVYNRPDCAEKNLQALNDNPKAANSRLYVFSDGAKNEEARAAVMKTREVLRAFKKNNNFKDMEIIEQPVNKGLAQSIVDGVSFVINEYGSIIVVEDDCIVSPYFLRFMNQALSYYKNDSSVGSISGWTPNLKYPVSFIADEFSILRSCSICWGTWADRWEDVDWDMNQYELIRHNQELIKRCNKTGNDRFVRYIRQKKFNLQSWSIRFGMTLVQRSQRTIYPRYSYAENIGHDSRGTHDNVEQVAAPFQVDAGKAIQDSTFLPTNKIMADASIEKQFRRIYGGNVLQRVKKYLYIHGVEKFMDIRRKS